MAKPTKIRIHPEFSAQRRSHPPNPALKAALAYVRQSRPESKTWGRVADLGCGKLRHYDLLLPCSSELYLVDTEIQLSASHVDAGQEYCVRDVAETAREQGKTVHTLTPAQFAASNLSLDLIVCVAALDVVVPRTRTEMTRAAARNLGASGLLILIAPRNDSTILRRCGPENAYCDGHIFLHHGIHTFYHNFRDHSPIVKICKNVGLVTRKDLSSYRQVCLVLSLAEAHVQQ
jgi:SAM-dependent methyltransferase